MKNGIFRKRSVTKRGSNNYVSCWYLQYSCPSGSRARERNFWGPRSGAEGAGRVGTGLRAPRSWGVEIMPIFLVKMLLKLCRIMPVQTR